MHHPPEVNSLNLIQKKRYTNILHTTHWCAECNWNMSHMSPRRVCSSFPRKWSTACLFQWSSRWFKAVRRDHSEPSNFCRGYSIGGGFCGLVETNHIKTRSKLQIPVKSWGEHHLQWVPSWDSVCFFCFCSLKLSPKTTSQVSCCQLFILFHMFWSISYRPKKASKSLGSKDLADISDKRLVSTASFSWMEGASLLLLSGCYLLGFVADSWKTIEMYISHLELHFKCGNHLKIDMSLSLFPKNINFWKLSKARRLEVRLADGVKLMALDVFRMQKPLAAPILRCSLGVG